MAELGSSPKPESPQYKIFKCGHSASGGNLKGPYWCKDKRRWRWRCRECRVERWRDGLDWHQQSKNHYRLLQHYDLYHSRKLLTKALESRGATIG